LTTRIGSTSPARYRQLGAAGEGNGRIHTLQTKAEPNSLTRADRDPTPAL